MTPRLTEETPQEPARLLKPYAAKKCRKALRRRGIKSKKIANKCKEHREKLGQHR